MDGSEGWQGTRWHRRVRLDANHTKDQPYRARNKVNGEASGGLGTKYGFSIRYGSPGGCHTFGDYAKKFPTDHPEYLSMNAQGKRIGAVDGSGPGGICLIHAEVRKLVLARLREFIAADRQRCAKAGTPPPASTTSARMTITGCASAPTAKP